MSEEWLKQHAAEQLRKAGERFSEQQHPLSPYRTGQRMPHVNAMLKSKYLGKQDLPQPQIAHIRGVAMEQGRGNEEPGWLMYFQELRKPLKLNNTILKYLAETIGPNSESWVGIKCKVYVDHSVMFGGQMVGGVRILVAKSARMSAADISQQMYRGAGGQQPQGSGGPVFAGNANVSMPTAGAGAAPFRQVGIGYQNDQPATTGTANQNPQQQSFDRSTGVIDHPSDPDFDDDIPF